MLEILLPPPPPLSKLVLLVCSPFASCPNHGPAMPMHGRRRRRRLSVRPSVRPSVPAPMLPYVLPLNSTPP